MSVWVEIVIVVMILLLFYSHAPRERVSWNSHVDWIEMNSALSRSTWACELKYDDVDKKIRNNTSRSTWACELKSILKVLILLSLRSRSTWACELKFQIKGNEKKKPSHAPRERVSWNQGALTAEPPPKVTLHVSVWVEMQNVLSADNSVIVTLHVSVWVEIKER